MALTKLNNQSLTAVTSAGLPSGTVLQVQSVNKVDNQRIVGTTFTDVMSVSITPTSTNSKILVMCDINISCSGGDNYEEGQRYSGVKLYRDSTQVAVNTDNQSSQTAVWFSSNQVQATSSGYGMMNSGGTFIDTPSTTSAITYKIQAANSHSAVQTFINRPSKTNNSPFIHQGTSTLTVMEIAG
jgi:hypothetical protein